MKIIRWLEDNILFVLTLFLLAFIPLYPKIPLIDIKNTWVYVRAEDLIVILVLIPWVLLLLRKKISLRTPLTIPILVYWIIGAIATIHGIVLIFPTLANVFPNVAFLSYMRRIEYMSLFFIAFSAMKDKQFLKYVIATITITLFFVAIYGIGQRYMGFPAYLTMNEEFAKGEPIRLSPLSRVPSTFAGHYDLAAYLVFILPIITSVIFGIRNWFIKLSLAAMVALGFFLMFMTVSRVSFFVLFIAMGIVLLFQKKKIVLFSLPIIALVTFVFVSFTPALLERFGNTIEEVDVLVDATTGKSIGHAKIVPAEYFKDKTIIRDYALEEAESEGVKISEEQEALIATTAAKKEIEKEASTSAGTSPFVDYTLLPKKLVLLVPVNTSTGENLPQGTGYINLSLSPVTQKTGEYFYEQQVDDNNPETPDVIIVHGNYLIKRAAAYDLSFTTRFQGEWPHAIEAFMRNIFLGSGYGSISLAIDNNYFRMLGEVGFLGTMAFLTIFATIGIYIRRVLPHVDSPLVRSFVLGYVAGAIGLALNAVLIDVFEASKVAFVLWAITGVTIGTLHLYQKENFQLYKEFKRFITSPFAVITSLGIIIFFIFSPMMSNYFVADDFTWFRWAAECQYTKNLPQCDSTLATIGSYFTDASGFFYRPGTKMYFLFMYPIFWLNQAVYHGVSLLLHVIVTGLIFVLFNKVLKDRKLAVLASFFFVLLSGYSEAVFWISSTGYLFTTMFALLSILFFIFWEEKKRVVYFVLSLVTLFLGLLFQELGIVTPLLIILYKLVYDDAFRLKKLMSTTYIALLFMPIAFYGILRLLAGSHWSGGDYSFSILKLPFNVIGNSIGYFMLTTLGPLSLSIYTTLRSILKEQMLVALLIALVMGLVLYKSYHFMKNRITVEDRKTLTFSLGFFIIALLPFLGLGNISSRYSYMASIGLVLFLSFCIKKLYTYLLLQGKDIALASIAVLTSLFILLQLMQLQQAHSDWRTAGDKAERFLIAVDEVYTNYWAIEPMKFYFVNVPIRTGEAWIFPVGLEDALWFSFQNDKMSVVNANSVKDALPLIQDVRHEKIFEFDEGGKIIEHRKPYNGT